jgi:hypothetical protein
MDPLDHLLALPDGLPCSVCDERVPATRVRLLARRDDLSFLQVDCPSCSSATLGFILAGQADSPSRGDQRTPITGDDVLDMHQLLATWDGDLAGLLANGRGRDAGGRGGAPTDPSR